MKRILRSVDVTDVEEIVKDANREILLDCFEDSITSVSSLTKFAKFELNEFYSCRNFVQKYELELTRIHKISKIEQWKGVIKREGKIIMKTSAVLI